MTEHQTDKTQKRTGKTVMSMEAITTVKEMNSFLLAKEFRGPGDTIEAAAYRLQTRYGIPVAITMRLRRTDVKDMFLSSFFPILNAYLAVKGKMEAAAERMEQAYEEKRDSAVDPRILRLSDYIAGRKEEKGGEGR
jgi:hypothetical protein